MSVARLALAHGVNANRQYSRSRDAFCAALVIALMSETSNKNALATACAVAAVDGANRECSRPGINSLAILVEQSMGLSPFERAVFAFCNGRRTRMKLLFFERSGSCLY
ncbi:IS66 family insertion sequence element accessory protein TnpB [Rhizobium hidalgonense]|nr:IS66 family insertion sequence element accessory protein TnpB [Rhizobium hidalgonense]MDR9818392.1 IS66 family insertion sequence element accessory protein TnpB [Rhizobium hidalgonense]